jgi:predicted phage terminase large subunit-like protein
MAVIRSRKSDLILEHPQAGNILCWLRSSLAALHAQARRVQRGTGDRQGFLAWAQQYLPQHFRLPPSRMHRILARHLEQSLSHRGTKLNVLGPRGSAKSTLVSLAYPLWCLLEEKERYIWLVSDTRHQARAHLENIKSELLNNPHLRERYGLVKQKGSVWRAEKIVLASGATMEAFGTGQRMRGRRQRADRPTLIIADDIQNDGHILSPRLRDRSRTWFHGTLMAAGSPATNVLHLATALHYDALAMELSRTAGWKTLIFRAIERFPRRTDLWDQWQEIYCDTDNPQAIHRARLFFQQHRQEMEEDAVVLWPEREDLYSLMCLRAEIGWAAFAREKQNAPVSPDLCEWPDEYFNDEIWFDTWPPNLKLCVAALDPSKGSDARRGDYSALIVLGVDGQGRMYVDADLARRPMAQMVADAADWCARWSVQAFGVEANQFQELLAEPLEAEFRRRGLIGFSPWLIRNHTSKLVRIRRLGPLLARRCLRFRRGSAGARLLVEQLRTFPIGDHDDGPDALEMAIRLAGELARSTSASPPHQRIVVW